MGINYLTSGITGAAPAFALTLWKVLDTSSDQVAMHYILVRLCQRDSVSPRLVALAVFFKYTECLPCRHLANYQRPLFNRTSADLQSDKKP